MVQDAEFAPHPLTQNVMFAKILLIHLPLLALLPMYVELKKKDLDSLGQQD